MSFDAYLKIDSIQGEASDDAHKDWIQLLSFEHGVSQPHGTSTAGGGARGGVERCDHLDFSIVKEVDKASAKLNLHCCNGINLKKVKVEVMRQANSKTPYLTYEFENCLVRSVMTAGGGDTKGRKATERVTFSYSKITWKYCQIKEDNTVGSQTESYWDMITNKGG